MRLAVYTSFAPLLIACGGGGSGGGNEQVSADAPPKARIKAEPVVGEAPLTVSFDGAQSSDDGEIASYEWHFGEDAAATGVDAEHTFDCRTSTLYP